MSEYLLETKSVSGSLGRNASLQIGFRVANPGLITVRGGSAGRVLRLPKRVSRARARAPGEGGEPGPESPLHEAPHRIDLFKPGQSTPVASRTSQIERSYLSYEATESEAGSQQDWVVRLTNLGERMGFNLFVSYPGTIELHEARIPLDLVNTFVNASLRGYRAKVTRGSNASYIEWPGDGAPEERRYYFTVPDFVYDPWWSSPIRAYPHDINSSGANGSVVPINGCAWLEAGMTFEEEGAEITGHVVIQLYNMKLAVNILLSAIDGNISYGSAVNATFTFGSNIQGIPDWLVDLLINDGYRGRVRNAVEDAVEQVFKSEEQPNIRENISATLSSAARAYIGVGNAEFLRVQADADNLLLTYILR